VKKVVGTFTAHERVVDEDQDLYDNGRQDHRRHQRPLQRNGLRRPRSRRPRFGSPARSVINTTDGSRFRRRQVPGSTSPAGTPWPTSLPSTITAR
jgi:hypothetical protein